MTLQAMKSGILRKLCVVKQFKNNCLVLKDSQWVAGKEINLNQCILELYKISRIFKIKLHSLFFHYFSANILAFQCSKITLPPILFTLALL